LDNNQKYNSDKDLKIMSRNFGNEFSASFSYKF